MEEAMTSINGVINTTAGAYFYQGQSFEELKQLLVCASMELKSQREATKAQDQLHDARVRHLEELLKTARRERDEYRDQCVKLTGMLSKARSVGSGLSQEPQLRTRSGLQPLESVASMSQEPQLRTRSGLQPLESVASMSQEPQLRTRSALQPLESVASMTEPSRATLTEMHRKVQLEYVSSMTEPTRDTLTEVHRKMQEQQQQQQQQQQLQQLDMQQLQHHHMDLQHQHSNHAQLDLRPSPVAAKLEFQSQHQHQLEELCQHFEIQKDHLPGQQRHMEMVINDRQAEVTRSGEVDNGSDSKSATWDEFPPSVHLDIHSSNEQCLIMESPEQMHMKLTQGLPTPHVDQRSSPHLDDLQQQLQQQQQQQQQHQQHQHPQDDNMQMHLHQQHQESDEILSHMQQGQTVDSHGLHLPDSKKLRRQLSKHQDLDGLVPISGGLQGTNDGVMNMSVLQQHPPWAVGLNGFTSAPLSNGPNGISEQLLQSSCLQGGSVVASILSPLERFGDSTSSSVLLSRPVHHLPEPPEADPQVMLNSLPEKGKLLQAVVQAGPLLQSLLLAGPLPQWRHPPPPLDAEEIPRVSMGAAVGIMPPGEQGIALMSNHGGSLEQVMRLTTPVQSSPSQNGFCH